MGDNGYKTWRKLQVALWQHKQKGQPIITGGEGEKYWISQVADRGVTLISESSSMPIEISEQDLENMDLAAHRQLAREEIVQTLWALGQYHADSP